MNLAEALSVVRVDRTKFYVYVLRRPGGGPFYVGKGRYDRISKHERDAANGQTKCYRLSIIRKAQRDGLSVDYEIAGIYSTESDAFAEERRLIALYGRFDKGAGPLTNNTDGGEGTSNPSEATIAKRALKLKALMDDPGYRARAVKCLRGAEPLRRERALAAVRTQGYRDRASVRFVAMWTRPEFRSKTIQAAAASRDLLWRAKQRAGVERIQADPGFHAKRNAARNSPEAVAKLATSLARPECVTKKRAKAIAQRARQEALRRRAIEMAVLIGVAEYLPDRRSSAQLWREVIGDLSMFVGNSRSE